MGGEGKGCHVMGAMPRVEGVKDSGHGEGGEKSGMQRKAKESVKKKKKTDNISKMIICLYFYLLHFPLARRGRLWRALRHVLDLQVEA